ncbi:T-complex protein 11 X-linked protein 2-like [Limanda limanda]|uniref:T-complex protein 11 X-linked protein 2-like n=1 Tax=Limanda limanda TaxID=27771 RepID=UPI0029C80189|nr:T-complex protein 11 X-linked protein 2-like [Limanda limanda]
MANQRNKAADDLPQLEACDPPAESPPNASLARLMELKRRFSNMSLAYEMVMNLNCCFEFQETPTSSLAGGGKDICQRKFWDILHVQLNSNPPNYSHAVTVLQEVKSILLLMLLPRHVRLRTQIDESLDMELIKKAADYGLLDVPGLMLYVIETVASMSAPGRIPEILALKDLKDPEEQLRNILRVLGLMMSDELVFTIQYHHLLLQHVQNEKGKSQVILDRMPAPSGQSPMTCGCLGSHNILCEYSCAVTVAGKVAVLESGCSGPSGKVSIPTILNRAYMRLLYWDPKDQKYPEIVLLDKARLDAVALRLQKLVLEASALLLTKAQTGDAVFFLQGFVDELKQTTAALLEDSQAREEDLKEALLGLGEKLVLQVNDAAKSQGRAALPQDKQDMLKGQICDLFKHNHRVRTLIGERLKGYLWAMLQAGPAKGDLDPPAPLGLVKTELAELWTVFRKIVHFNKAAFGPLFAPILRKLLMAGAAETST